MRAIRLHARGDPERLEYEDAPLPDPAAGEALLRVYAAGVTPTELTWSETYQTPDGRGRLPTIPGHDVSGVVEALGPGVSDVSPGDAVHGLVAFPRDGSAAEYAAVRAADWPAAQAAAVVGGGPGLISLTADRARRCRELWLESIRARIAGEGLDEEALHALAGADAGDLPEYVREALDQEHTVSLSAVQLIRDDPSYVPEVARLFSGASGDPRGDLLAGPCAEYLARHGHRVREMLGWLGSPRGRQIGRAALLAVEHCREMALQLLRRALRSTAPHDRLTAAAVLALGDRPWSHNEPLDESDHADATAGCRAALRESRVPEVRRAAVDREERYPVRQDTPRPFARELDQPGGGDRELTSRIAWLRDRVDIGRLRELSPALRDDLGGDGRPEVRSSDGPC